MKKCNDNGKTTEWNCTVAWDRSRQRLHAGAILFAVCAFSAGAPVWAQDVAEAARQEQARKDKQSKRQKHVYTEEDLKRARILTREDRQLLDAKKREQIVPGAATPPTDVDAQVVERLPLGDVARMFRALKELSQAAQSVEFHLPVANAELASPKAKPEFAIPKPSAVQPSTRRTPVGPEFPSAAAPLTIIVKSGDSFWKLAQVNLGDGHRWHEIAAVNPSIVDPQHIVPGTPINITLATPSAPVAPAAPSDSQITVRKGDSLWKIAQIKLGSGGFWGCIAKANPVIIDANRIYTGQVLNLPTSCVTRRGK